MRIFPTLGTVWSLGTNYGRYDFWDRLGARCPAVVIGLGG